MTFSKIIFRNYRGVTRGHLELLNLAKEREIDILLLNETHLSNNLTFKIQNVIIYISNRLQQTGHSPAGGITTLIDRKHIHQHVSINSISIENTIVELKFGQFEIRLAAV